MRNASQSSAGADALGGDVGEFIVHTLATEARRYVVATPSASHITRVRFICVIIRYYQRHTSTPIEGAYTVIFSRYGHAGRHRYAVARDVWRVLRATATR